MAFTDDDLKELKDNLSRFGIDPGIDVCNYFEEPYEIANLVARLETAEAHIQACDEFHGFDKNDMPFIEVWRKAAKK